MADGQQRSREWIIAEDRYASEDAFRQAVRQELADLETLGYRTGRAVIAAPIRIQAPRPIDNEMEWITIGWRFQEAFVPAARVLVPDVEEPAAEIIDEPLPEPEPATV